MLKNENALLWSDETLRINVQNLEHNLQFLMEFTKSKTLEIFDEALLSETRVAISNFKSAKQPVIYDLLDL